MASVVIWRYRENKFKLTWPSRGAGGAVVGAGLPTKIMVGETLKRITFLASETFAGFEKQGTWKIGKKNTGKMVHKNKNVKNNKRMLKLNNALSLPSTCPVCSYPEVGMGEKPIRTLSQSVIGPKEVTHFLSRKILWHLSVLNKAQPLGRERLAC